MSITDKEPPNIDPRLKQMAEEHKNQGFRVWWRPDGLVLYVQITRTSFSYESRYICLNDTGVYVNRAW